MSLYTFKHVMQVNDETNRNAAVVALADWLINTVGGFTAVGSGTEYQDIRHTASNRILRFWTYNYYGQCAFAVGPRKADNSGELVGGVGNADLTAPSTMEFRILISPSGLFVYLYDGFVVVTQDTDDNWLTGCGTGLQGLTMYTAADAVAGTTARMQAPYMYNDSEKLLQILFPVLIWDSATSRHKRIMKNMFGCKQQWNRGWFRLGTGEYGFVNYDWDVGTCFVDFDFTA